MSTVKHHEFPHYDPSQPCCETPASADLFPDLLHLLNNEENRGRVASTFIESIGIEIQGRQLTMDESVWNECVKHPNFQACYDLSRAKLALQDAMQGH